MFPFASNPSPLALTTKLPPFILSIPVVPEKLLLPGLSYEEPSPPATLIPSSLELILILPPLILITVASTPS